MNRQKSEQRLLVQVPLRDEQTASFKVNRKLNVWYDHGIGKGGDLIDFGKEYFRCTTSELLQKLPDGNAETFLSPAGKPKLSNSSNAFLPVKKKDDKGQNIGYGYRAISDSRLMGYLEKRNIPLEVAKQYCHEVNFMLYGKKQTAIGFKNNSGGYELRSAYFKGSSSPKSMSFIDVGSKSLNAF
jgi:hypothetical protein